jgi:PEP-CTERM motif
MKLQWCYGAAACAGLALVAVLGVVKPAKADTIVVDFTVNGTGVEHSPLVEEITSSSFADFDAAIGTLTGVTLSFMGTAKLSPSSPFATAGLLSVGTADRELFLGSAGGFGGSFPISANGTVSDAVSLSMFEGSGTQALVFIFGVEFGTLSMSGQSGTLTYDYIPTTLAAPEPSTWAMMALGFVGLGHVGYRRRTAAATA